MVFHFRLVSFASARAAAVGQPDCSNGCRQKRAIFFCWSRRESRTALSLDIKCCTSGCVSALFWALFPPVTRTDGGGRFTRAAPMRSPEIWVILNSCMQNESSPIHFDSYRMLKQQTIESFIFLFTAVALNLPLYRFPARANERFLCCNSVRRKSRCHLFALCSQLKRSAEQRCGRKNASFH